MKEAFTKKIFFIGNTVPYVLLWLLLTSVAPFAFFALPMHPGKFMTFFLLVIIVMLVFVKRKIQNFHLEIIFILLVQTVFYLTAAFYHNDIGYINLVFQNITIIITYFFILQYISIENFVKSYLKVIQFMILMGIPVFFYAFFGGKNYSVFEFIDDREILNYIISFAKAPFEIEGGLLLRISGFFDEPGAFAFFIIQALLLNKIYFNNKKTEIILIFGGTITFSLAYFISLFLYYIFFYLTLKPKRIFLVLGIIFVLVFSIQVNKNSSVAGYFIYIQTIGRLERIFEGDERGEIVLDNRSDLVEGAFEAFRDAPLLGHGIQNVPQKYGYFGANIFGSLANHGIIGFFFVFMPFSFVVLYSLNIRKYSFLLTDTFKSTLILFVNYLQRPDFTGLLIILLIIAFLHKIKQNNRMKYYRVSDAGN